VNPKLDDPEAFLKRLVGLVKHAIRTREGRARVSTLAAATAQRAAAVSAGIAWLLARGNVAIVEEQGDEIRFAAGGGIVSPDLPRVAAELKAMLEETAAYRAHFARADAASLISVQT